MAITKNKSAYEYFKNAYDFSTVALSSGAISGYQDKSGTDITRGYDLLNLSVNNAQMDSEFNLADYYNGNVNELIFKETDSSIGIEDANSKFNKHRALVIRNVVESNLKASIASFESNAKGTNFIMPKISESDWEIIENDVCAISFLQGMNMGSKKYNGYAVVANNLTNAYIDEDDIYILTNEGVYCKANDKNILPGGRYNIKTTGIQYKPGIWKTNFEIKQDISSGTTIYYVPLGKDYLGSYTSIIGSSGLESIQSKRYV